MRRGNNVTELHLLGINVDSAPVLDINMNPDNPVIGARSFSDDPDVVSEYGLKYMEGLHEEGVMATLKHFPGHGDDGYCRKTGRVRGDQQRAHR